MKYLSVTEYAALKGVSDRTIRNYCAAGKLRGAVLTGKVWTIPEDALLPSKGKHQLRESHLLEVLRREKEAGLRGSIYHRLQVEMTYNSNHIEGSRLTEDQTRLIFETQTIGVQTDAVRVDDVVETVNHFRCIDMVIDHAGEQLTEAFVKDLHRMLKTATADAGRSWFVVGDYKRFPNEVGGQETTAPEKVSQEMRALLKEYNAKTQVSLDDIIDLHQRMERIHPFQDGNGRVGRLVMLKECLRWRIVPFIITDSLKAFYYRGLQEWPLTPGYLRDTCLTAQDAFRALMAYFRISED